MRRVGHASAEPSAGGSCAHHPGPATGMGARVLEKDQTARLAQGQDTISVLPTSELNRIDNTAQQYLLLRIWHKCGVSTSTIIF